MQTYSSSLHSAQGRQLGRPGDSSQVLLVHVSRHAVKVVGWVTLIAAYQVGHFDGDPGYGFVGQFICFKTAASGEKHNEAVTYSLVLFTSFLTVLGEPA